MVKQEYKSSQLSLPELIKTQMNKAIEYNSHKLWPKAPSLQAHKIKLRSLGPKLGFEYLPQSNFFQQKAVKCVALNLFL
jgi:hypothetical protein